MAAQLFSSRRRWRARNPHSLPRNPPECLGSTVSASGTVGVPSKWQLPDSRASGPLRSPNQRSRCHPHLSTGLQNQRYIWSAEPGSQIRISVRIALVRMEHSAGRIYEFGRHRYDAVQRLLFRDATLIPLAPKTVETLHVLIARRGRIVEKDELLQRVWPDTTVEEVGLARNISLLRRALEDSEGSIIETIPRRGYRFVAEVRQVDERDGETEAALAETVTTLRNRRPWKRLAIIALALAFVSALVYWQFYRPSRFLTLKPGTPGLAVVPFECVGGGTSCGNMPQVISDLLVTDLVRLGGMSVVSQSTVRRHQRAKNSMGLMGRLLALDVLVEGTVQVTGDHARIMSRLVDVHTGRLIWADTAVFAANDAERMQEAVARQIAVNIAAHLAIHQSFSQRDTPSP